MLEIEYLKNDIEKLLVMLGSTNEVIFNKYKSELYLTYQNIKKIIFSDRYFYFLGN